MRCSFEATNASGWIMSFESNRNLFLSGPVPRHHQTDFVQKYTNSEHERLLKFEKLKPKSYGVPSLDSARRKIIGHIVSNSSSLPSVKSWIYSFSPSVKPV